MIVSKKKLYQYSCLVVGIILTFCAFKAIGASYLSEENDSPASSVVMSAPGPELLFASDALTLRAMFRRLGSEIWLKKIERIPGDPDHADYVEFDTEAEFSVSYRIYNITARHPNELYVVGVSRWGDTLVERWDFVPRGGESFTTRESATPAVGIAVPNSTIVLDVLKDPGAPLGVPDQYSYAAPFIAPPSRQGGPAPLPPIRTEIYRGLEIGAVSDVVCDPEGRFLILTSFDDASVYQLILSDPPIPVELYNSTNLPGLEPDSAVIVREHLTQGRTYTFFTSSDPLDRFDDFIIFACDPNNDGVFDTEVSLTRAQYDADATYSTPENWTEHYFHNYLFGGG